MTRHNTNLTVQACVSINAGHNNTTSFFPEGEGEAGRLPKRNVLRKPQDCQRDLEKRFRPVLGRLLRRNEYDRWLRRVPRQFNEVRLAARGSEFRQISLHLWPLPKVLQSFPQNRGSRFVPWRDKTVVHPSPLAPSGGNARAAQIGQVARDFWLAHPENPYKVTDTNLLVGDEAEKAKARGIG